MADAVLTKNVAATFDYDMEFSDMMGSAEAIVTKTVTAVDSAGTDVASTITPSSSITGTKVRVHVAAGTDLEDYTIGIAATCTSNVYTRVLELRVRTDPIEGSNKT